MADKLSQRLILSMLDKIVVAYKQDRTAVFVVEERESCCDPAQILILGRNLHLLLCKVRRVLLAFLAQAPHRRPRITEIEDDLGWLRKVAVEAWRGIAA